LQDRSNACFVHAVNIILCPKTTHLGGSIFNALHDVVLCEIKRAAEYMILFLKGSAIWKSRKMELLADIAELDLEI